MWSLAKFKKKRLAAIFLFLIYAFQNRLILLTDANTKWLIVMDNAYYGLNMPKGLKNNLFLMKKRAIWGACKVSISAWSPSAWSQLVDLDPNYVYKTIKFVNYSPSC